MSGRLPAANFVDFPIKSIKSKGLKNHDNLQLASFLNLASEYNFTNDNQQKNIISIIHEHYQE
jgi:hypothetical protein